MDLMVNATFHSNHNKRFFLLVSVHTELQVVEGTARITEARLKREVGEGKIIDFRCTEEGYEVIRLEPLNVKENKVRRLLTMFGCAAKIAW